MTHVRQQLRSQAKTLITGLGTTGANVFARRLFQLEQDQLPCWSVMIGDEEIDNNLGDCQDRIVRLEFDGWARELDGETLANKLDTMLEELEAVMVKSGFTVALKSLDLLEIEVDVDIDDTDHAFGMLTAVYAARYATAEGAPGTAI